MKIKDIIGLITDTKLYFEIKEKASGSSFDFYTIKSYVSEELLEKQVIGINVQYINGKRLLIIKF